MKTYQIILIILIACSCSEKKAGYLGVIKSIETKRYSIDENNDTSYYKVSNEYFNTSGKTDSLIDFNEGERLNHEYFYTYNDRGILTKLESINHYGKGSIEIKEYMYNEMDSLIKLTINENDFILTIDFQRNNSNQIKVKKFTTSRDGLIETDSFSYNVDNKLTLLKKYNGFNNLIFQNQKNYNLDKQLLDESIIELNQYDTTTMTVEYFYNSSNQIDSTKQSWLNSDSYHLTKFTYHENGELKQTIRECYGCIRSATMTQEFDVQGNLILHKRIGPDGVVKEWSYKLVYDKNGNWIAKHSSYKSENKTGLLRKIEYD